jgi:hypothetical protein
MSLENATRLLVELARLSGQGAVLSWWFSSCWCKRSADGG